LRKPYKPRMREFAIRAVYKSIRKKLIKKK